MKELTQIEPTSLGWLCTPLLEAKIEIAQSSLGSLTSKLGVVAKHGMEKKPYNSKTLTGIAYFGHV